MPPQYLGNNALPKVTIRLIKLEVTTQIILKIVKIYLFRLTWVIGQAGIWQVSIVSDNMMNILSISHILAILYTNTYIGRLVIIAIQKAPKNTIFQSNITVRVTTKNHLGAPCCYFMQHCHFSQRPLNVRDIQVCQESYFQDTVSIS